MAGLIRTGILRALPCDSLVDRLHSDTNERHSSESQSDDWPIHHFELCTEGFSIPAPNLTTGQFTISNFVRKVFPYQLLFTYTAVEAFVCHALQERLATKDNLVCLFFFYKSVIVFIGHCKILGTSKSASLHIQLGKSLWQDVGEARERAYLANALVTLLQLRRTKLNEHKLKVLDNLFFYGKRRNIQDIEEKKQEIQRLGYKRWQAADQTNPGTKTTSYTRPNNLN